MGKTKKKLAYLTAGSLLMSAVSSMPAMANPLTGQEDNMQKQTEILQMKAAETQETTESALSLQYKETEVLLADFENSSQDGWTSRGTAEVQIVQQERNATTTGCLYVSGRTANWHGTSKDFSSIVQKGREYLVGAWIKFDEGAETESLSMTLQYNAKSETSTKYTTVASNKQVKKGEWTYFEGVMDIPEDMISATLYVEAASAELSFYVDDILVKGDFTKKEVTAEIEQDIPSLKDVYAQYFKMGTAIGSSHLNDVEKELVAKHFNSITCENEMKPENMLDYDATIRYMEQNNGDQTHPQITLKNNTRKILDFAQENNISMRGHVLVWHSQTPNWLFTENYSKEIGAPVVSKEVMLQRMENYIKAVFEVLEEEYPDVEFYAFDVVNEAINPSRADGMREPAVVAGTTGDDNNNENAGKSMWMTTIGEEYIEKAYEYARKYAPAGVQLAYNDYNECDPVKSEFIYNMCKKLVEQGNLDVIGMQGHHNMTSPSISQFETALRKYGSLGVKLEITELDITQPDGSDRGMLEQAYRYKDFFDTMKRIEDEGTADIDAVVLWGVKDDESWRSENSPLIFDENYQAKKAYWGIVDPSQLTVLPQNMKGYFTTDASYASALKVQPETSLLTAGEEQLASVKVAASSDKVYVQISPSAAYEGQQGSMEIWVNGEKFSSNLSSEKVVTIPVSQVLQAGSQLKFDISIAYGEKRATWNNTYYNEDGNNQFGMITFAEVPKIAVAMKGTPVIDGQIDSIWGKAEVAEVNQFSVGKDGATAKARMLWDKDYVYVLLEVSDSLLSKASSDAYQQDSVEIFIDEDNAKSVTYEKGDVQYRVNFDNEQSINGSMDAERFTTATRVTDGGYIVEAAIPTLLGNFKTGEILGFDLQVNDDADGNGKRDYVSNWNDLTGNGWSSTAGYGILELKEEQITSSEDDDDDSSSTGSGTTNSSTDSTQAAQTNTQTVDESILSQLKDGAVIKMDMNGSFYLTPATVEALRKADSQLLLSGQNVSFVLGAAFFKDNFQAAQAMTLTSTALTDEELNQISKSGENSGIHLLGGAGLGINLAVQGTKEARFTEPMQVVFDLPASHLTDAAKLTAVKFEKNKDGSWEVIKVGGNYDAKTGKLTAYVSEAGLYGVAEADALLTISMTIGSREMTVNGLAKTCDTEPQIINGNTMVPLRFIAENLGAEVKWNAVTKQITVFSGEQTIQMKLGEQIKGYDMATVIQEGRTLVPLEYIAEKLGADVSFIPSIKGIEIVR